MMIYQNKRVHAATPGGFLSFEEETGPNRLHGFGYGDHIRLRDDQGKLWRGSAERGTGDTVHYTFRRDEDGHTITGIANSFGAVLRDGKGKTWRGFAH